MVYLIPKHSIIKQCISIKKFHPLVSQFRQSMKAHIERLMGKSNSAVDNKLIFTQNRFNNSTISNAVNKIKEVFENTNTSTILGIRICLKKIKDLIQR